RAVGTTHDLGVDRETVVVDESVLGRDRKRDRRTSTTACCNDPREAFDLSCESGSALCGCSRATAHDLQLLAIKTEAVGCGEGYALSKTVLCPRPVATGDAGRSGEVPTNPDDAVETLAAIAQGKLQLI